jgi:CheY-like chemotaxis protein
VFTSSVTVERYTSSGSNVEVNIERIVTFFYVYFFYYMGFLGKYKILIVDDDICIIKDIMHILVKNPDYLVLTTDNGLSACQIANFEYPDLIIMDWQMPVMDGIEATKQLKQSDSTKDIPIIISTGVMIEPADLCFALLTGAVDYLRKPVDEIELLARVANMLRISEMYSKARLHNSELESRLTTNLINIQQFNELKIATIKQLTNLKEYTSVLYDKKFKEIILKTERLLYSKTYQVYWEDFEYHFEFIHSGFFKKLKNNIGDFTPNELRLCAFIRLNMSNKEIALINFTSPDSVNTARKRLKKKLGLLPHESLQLFIHNL